MLSIRLAAPEDLQDIARLHRTSISVLCKGDYAPEVIEIWTDLLRPEIYLQALQEKIFLVAETGGCLHGFGMLDILGKNVSALYVAPEKAGCGIGTAILHAMEHRAVQQALESLTVHATSNSVSFYTRNGFRRIADSFHKLPDGTRLACVVMEKSLL